MGVKADCPVNDTEVAEQLFTARHSSNVGGDFM